MSLSLDAAALGLWLQLSSALLTGFLFLLIGRQAVPSFHRWWTAAWAALALALAARAGGGAGPPLVWARQFFELAFALALWQGTRLLRDKGFPVRTLALATSALALFAAAVTAFALSTGWRPLEALRPAPAAHAAAMVLLYAVASGTALSAGRRSKDLGPRVLAAVLAALSLASLVLAAAGVLALRPGGAAAGILFYSPFLAPLLQFAVAFAMLLCRSEYDQRRLSSFNLGLASAHRDLIQTYALLREEAERDPLTDAYNRMAFRRFWKEAGARFARGCVALIDMDSLKELNDRHGHEAGDRAIRLVADAIRGLFRSEDPLFRWGGDEFLVLLPDADSEDTSRRLGRLNATLAREWEGPPPGPQASWGIGTFESPQGFADALKSADASMYEAKKRPSPQKVV